jgi:hypothetical protein
MRILSITRISLLALLAITLFSCKDEKEEFSTEKINDYLPVVTGKYITYRLDSLVFTRFDQVAEIHKYQVKHVVDALITDNLGRPSYRVYKFIRDSVNTSSWTPAQPWVPAGSYFITPLSDQLELIEDNLRFIKLHLPIKDGFSWKANAFLPNKPYATKYFFSNDNDIQDWDSHYDGTPTSFSYRGINYADVLTVASLDSSHNIPVTLPGSFGYKTKVLDKYAKNIGMVYRDYILYEYQPDPNPGGPNYAYRGFGVTMWMIDHN